MKRDTRLRALHTSADLHSLKTFFSQFDEGPKSGIYCKAPLNTASRQKTAEADSGEAVKAAQRDQAKKSNFFDSAAKTDVYYEAQLIAAKQADEDGESRRVCRIIKNTQPISVGV